MNVSNTMHELGIDKQNFRTLGLLPLVFVAWADGSVQRAEETFIRRVARDKGWLVGSGEELLDKWLSEPPDTEYVEKGLALINKLATERHGFSGGLTAESLGSLLVLCKDVAEAAGGMWGLGESICAEEERALVLIAEAFGIGDATTWRRIVSALEAEPSLTAPGPRGHILLGELPSVSRDPLGLFMRSYQEYGDVVRLRMPGMEWTLISHPDHVKHVLVDHSRNYVRGASYDRFRLLFGESVGTTDGERWRPLRRIAQPMFHRRAIAGMAQMMIRCTDEMVDQWKERPDPEQPLDLVPALQRLTLRIIGLALFSVDMQDEKTSELSESVEVALHYMAGSTNPLRMPAAVPTPTNRRFARAMKRFESFVLSTLAARREEGDAPPDLMSMLLDAVDPETGEGLPHLQIRNEMLSYLVAGHETSAATLTWMMYLLSRHPGVARKVERELQEVLGDARPTVEDLDRLTYLSQVIKETLRLYPIAFMLPREVVSEDRLGGYTIPAKSWVLVAPWVTHRRPDVWENPEGFDPDRFAPDAPVPPPGAYFPFFLGPHKCMGQAMAMMEIKLIVATLLRRCRLDLWSGFEPRIDAQITLRAKDGMLMQARWRESTA